MSRIDFPKIYNPANQTQQELIENFVVRTRIFKEIFEDIKYSEMKYPEQHYIIQGVRGQGKTTLLLRIAYAINRDTDLRQRIIPIIFNEEQYNISRLFKLWETIAEYMEDAGDIKGLYDEMQKLDNNADYEWRCFQILENALKKHKKKMIVFIDNIDEMLTKFTEKEHRRLREVFMESAELRIVGASSVSLEFHYDYAKPFYQFFKMPQLKGLGTEETKTLLLKLGEHYKRERVKDIVNNQPGRVEALRRVTGGVIRTIVILFDIFVDDTNGNAFMDLEKVLDTVTPLYKHRMDKLSAQQQEIVDFIALSWDAVSTKEIAHKTRIESKAVSAQLKQLERFHIIEKEKTDTKNYLYRIYERFFNIWYLMRLGRKWDKRRVRFFVEFLQVWCDERELENRARKHLEAIKLGKLYEKQALYMTEALARTPIQRELQHQLIVETRSYLDNAQSELKGYLSRSDYELKESAMKVKDQNISIQHLEQIKINNSEDLTQLGLLYWINKKDIKKAKDFFLKAVAKEHAGAMFNLALLYETEFKDFKQAEKYYLMAVEKEHIGAMNSLAGLYFEQKSHLKQALKIAEQAYKKAENIYNMYTYSIILLWNNEIEQAFKIAQEFLTEQESLDKFPEDVSLFLMLLMAKKQYHLTLKIFNENPHHLKDRLKPVYYALMFFMQKEDPNEYRKMGNELKQTVEEILEKIHQLAHDYS
ncbi:MAG: hypothetical protein ACE5HS_12255 [bacterium]